MDSAAVLVGVAGYLSRLCSCARTLLRVLRVGVSDACMTEMLGLFQARLKTLEPKYQFYQELWHFVDNMAEWCAFLFAGLSLINARI